jgi:hypothetical protein
MEDSELAVANKGTNNECLERGTQPTLFLDYLKEHAGVIPAQITLTRRVKSGAKNDYFADAAKGPIRKKAYEMHGIPVDALETFPVLFNKSGQPTSNKDSWKFSERMVIEVSN